MSFSNMALARLHCVCLMLLYSKITFGQQAGTTNQNNVSHNAIGLHQQTSQRISQNNQNPNAPNSGLSINPVQSNIQANNLQQSPTLSFTKAASMQQKQNLLPNMQSQNLNNMQITKIGFSPVPPNISSTTTSSVQFPNANGQIMQSQFPNLPNTNAPVSHMPKAPIQTLTLGDLMGLKGQSLFSLINAHNGQLQQNQQNHQNIPSNGISVQNQLSDMQKQFLMRSFQTQDFALNQNAMHTRLKQPITTSFDNQQTIAVQTVPAPQQGPALVEPIGPEQSYLTVQAQPLGQYLQYNAAATTTAADPIMSLIPSEFGAHASYPLVKKGSKITLKSLIPLIINLLKEKNSCGCQHCKCQNRECQSKDCSKPNMDPYIAQMLGWYGSGVENRVGPNPKTTLDHNLNNNQKKITRKNVILAETEEETEEDDSEYVDED